MLFEECRIKKDYENLFVAPTNGSYKDLSEACRKNIPEDKREAYITLKLSKHIHGKRFDNIYYPLNHDSNPETGEYEWKEHEEKWFEKLKGHFKNPQTGKIIGY